ncbi:MAG TPA: DUF4382 domain-containing protein [Balneolaceae bacterium]|nr:DUF4382 domain-containing protein [Balneolaceae bacterium]
MLPKKLLSIPFAILAVLSLLFTGCGTGSNTGMGSMELRMYDAPIDSASAVNVKIDKVEINRTGSANGWDVISTPNKMYNLLDLANGAYAVLGDTTLEAGTYPQIRLVLSQDSNNVVVNGKTYGLTIPSGSQTGIKLDVNAKIEKDINYVLLLDFDAARSVVQAGGQGSSQSKYLLKPVIRAKNKATTGNIGGIVNPTDAKAVVYAIANSDTLASTVADTTDGTFKLVGLDEGDYAVSIDPRNDNYQSKDSTGVHVTLGETNDLGTITLSQSGVQ